MASARAEIANRGSRLGKANGAFEAICVDERKRGYTLQHPGQVRWLPADDWPDNIVISKRGRLVRIVAIYARKRGAFSRLISALAREHLIPIVLEPMGIMPEILTRWGWEKKPVGRGFESEEQWRPTAQWLLERAAA